MKMDKPDLAVVVITKNEEKKIRRCLSSVSSLASQIIVVDDVSTDDTAGIARSEFAAKVIVNPASGNFDNQRNLGIEAAEREWILQMDADEEVPEETARAIKNAIAGGTDAAAFSLVRRDCVFGVPLKHAGQEKAVKLFRKGRARYTGSKIHETLRVDGRTGEIDSFVLHYNFDSIRQVIARWNYYTDIESASYIRENGYPPLGPIKKRLLYKSVKLFYKHYIKRGASRDGVHGLIWAVLHVISPLLFWLKVYEKSVKENFGG
ncbi:MAG: glycosyltransferase [Candidatus Omnitrophica bacterium]|nr:glycosyltransferase [Candidatus Omnitrophota bacterium]